MLGTGFDVEKSIMYQMTQTQVELQELSVKREKSTYLPSLSAFYQHQEQFNAPDFNFVIPDMVGLQLKVPIFSSGQRYKRVQQAQIELEKAKITRGTVERALNIEHQSLLDQLNTSWGKAQLEKDNMSLAKRIYDRTLIKFNEGMASSLELTQAQNQYLETQSNYFNAMLEVLRARNKMKRLMEDQAN
jgi:outer membrane protein